MAIPVVPDQESLGRVYAATRLVEAASNRAGAQGTVPRFMVGSLREHPFQIYVGGGTGDSAWRTFRVRAGLVEDVHNEQDDSNETPDDIVVPAATSLYKIWGKLAIKTDDDSEQGTVDTVTIEYGATGWTNFPRQPAPDFDNQKPADTRYFLIAEITTGSDTLASPPETTPPTSVYRFLKIHQYIKTNLGAGMTSPVCGIRRIDLWRR